MGPLSSLCQYSVQFLGMHCLACKVGGESNRDKNEHYARFTVSFFCFFGYYIQTFGHRYIFVNWIILMQSIMYWLKRFTAYWGMAYWDMAYWGTAYWGTAHWPTLIEARLIEPWWLIEPDLKLNHGGSLNQIWNWTRLKLKFKKSS